MGCDLRSDNVLGSSPEIIEAVTRASAGTATSYGGDEYTKRVRDLLSDIFETDVEIFPVITGSAANALAISALTSPWGAVFCHRAEPSSGRGRLHLVRTPGWCDRNRGARH